MNNIVGLRMFLANLARRAQSKAEVKLIAMRLPSIRESLERLSQQAI